MRAGPAATRLNDMVGLLDALGSEQAVIAGHDWGAPVAWHAALLRPDRFRAAIALGVPFLPRSPVVPTSVTPHREDAIFYQLYFQQLRMAEAELERDVRQASSSCWETRAPAPLWRRTKERPVFEPARAME
jgi:pimeloyl-ACP methyl ester carboxylesterase